MIVVDEGRDGDGDGRRREPQLDLLHRLARELVEVRIGRALLQCLELRHGVGVADLTERENRGTASADPAKRAEWNGLVDRGQRIRKQPEGCDGIISTGLFHLRDGRFRKREIHPG